MHEKTFKAITLYWFYNDAWKKLILLMVISTNRLHNKIILGTIFNPFIGLHFLISCIRKFIHHIKPYIYMASWILLNLLSSLTFCCFIFVFGIIVAAITLSVCDLEKRNLYTWVWNALKFWDSFYISYLYYLFTWKFW